MRLGCAMGGRRMSQWSRGVRDGVHVGDVGSQMWYREALVKNSARGGYGRWDVGFVCLGGLRPEGLGGHDVLLVVWL